MTVQPNGTDAKEIALHFLRETGVERATSLIISKTIAQTKTILEAGYTKDEIISVINTIVSKGIHMYSIGYVSACINDVLREIEEEKRKEEAKRVRQEMEQQHAEKREAVSPDVETTQRNRNKARRLGVQSRKRAESYLDMLKGE